MKFTNLGVIYDTDTATFLGESKEKYWNCNEYGIGPLIKYSYYRSPRGRIFKITEAKKRICLFFTRKPYTYGFVGGDNAQMIDDMSDHGLDVSGIAELG